MLFWAVVWGAMAGAVFFVLFGDGSGDDLDERDGHEDADLD